jgi:hypothetical protein
MTLSINGVDYPLATTLRVAYKIQGQHNHKAYSKVFAEIGDMTLEDQIGILYASFQVANPEMTMTKASFLDNYLDNYNLKVLMDQVKEIIQGIMGTEPGYTCSCGASVTTKFCPDCGARNPEFVATQLEDASDSQGN